MTGDLMWEMDMQQYTDGNFKPTRRSFRRGRQTIVNARLGFLERIGHGKYVEWVRNEEQGGYYEIK